MCVFAGRTYVYDATPYSHTSSEEVHRCSICMKYVTSTSGVGKEGRKVRRAASNPRLERCYVLDREVNCSYEFETRLVAHARTHACDGWMDGWM